MSPTPSKGAVSEAPIWNSSVKELLLNVKDPPPNPNELPPPVPRLAMSRLIALAVAAMPIKPKTPANILVLFRIIVYLLVLVCFLRRSAKHGFRIQHRLSKSYARHETLGFFNLDQKT
jgi:hypothetical protein